MLSKKKRLTKSSFNTVIDEGKSFHTSVASLRIKETAENSQFSISIPKKVSRSAVVRNKIRRKVFSIIKDIYPDIQKSVMGIVIMKQGSDKLDFDILTKEIIDLFVKSGLLK